MEIILFIFLLGLIIGSFLNVVVLRLHAGEGFVSGRSRCTACSHELEAFDMVPVVSFIMLRGRCRYCDKVISLQYPLVELATAVLFTLAYLQFGLTLIFLCVVVTFSGLMILFVYDALFQIVPDRVSIPTFLTALAASVLMGTSFTSIGIGVLLGGGFFLLQFILSRGKWIGGGDIRLGMIGGALLGWPLTVLFLFISYVAGSVITLLLTAARRQVTLKSYIPFGPYLILGMLVSLFWGQAILEWYISLL